MYSGNILKIIIFGTTYSGTAESHATLKNGLGFPSFLFSVLAFFITIRYFTLRLTVSTSAL
jgi:hypothetical protein